MDNSYKYKAFISYRHKELDKEVAANLQKMLESYKPPKSVAGAGFKSWRVFRDETELNTSSSLGDNITDALENSEFLIVVCSETTKESKWCMQEITHFKELHNGSNKNIITVVADGDPTKVFPPELCMESVILTDEEGREYYENREIEPMAANIAGESKKETLKKLKGEFLRVAAPLTGCDYDDLYKRNQKKKIRQIITASVLIMALLLAFGLYSSAMLFQINAKNNQLEEQKMQLNASYEELKITNEELEKKTKEANDNYLEAQSQKETAESNLAEAQKQKKMAEDNLKEAQRQKKMAEDNLKEAERQKKMAEDNLAEATRQKTIAQTQKQKADENAAEAVLQKSYAEENMRIAQDNEAKANEANRNLTEKNAEILASQAQMYYDDSRLVYSATAARDAIKMQQDLGMDISPDAQRVLTETIGAYSTSPFTLKDVISISDTVKEMITVPGGEYLAAVDESGYFYLIDLEARKIKGTQSISNIVDIKATEDAVYVITYSEVYAFEPETMETKWVFEHDKLTYFSNIMKNPQNSSIAVFAEYANQIAILSDIGEHITDITVETDENRSFNFDASDFEGDYLYITDSRYKSTAENGYEAKIHKINIKTGEAEKSVNVNFNGEIIKISKIGNRLFALCASGYNAEVYALDADDLSFVWSTPIEKASVYFSKYSYNEIGVYSIDGVDYVAVLAANGFFALNYETGELASSRAMAENAEILGYMYTSPVGINVITTKGWELCHLDEGLVLGNNFYNGGMQTKAVYVPERKLFVYADDLAELYLYRDIVNENAAFEEILTADSEYSVEESYFDNGEGYLASISKKKSTDTGYEFKIDVCDVKNKNILGAVEVKTEGYTIKADFVDKDKLLISDGYKMHLYNVSGDLLSSVDLVEEGKAATGRSWISFTKEFKVVGNSVVCEGLSCCLHIKLYGEELSVTGIIPAKAVTVNASGDYVFVMNGENQKAFFIYKVKGSEPMNIYDGENVLELIADNCKVKISEDGRFIVILSGSEAIYLYDTENRSLQKKEFKATDKIPLVFAVSPDSRYIIAIATDKTAVKYLTSDLNTTEISEAWAGGSSTTGFEFISDNDIFINKSSTESVVFDCEKMQIRTLINRGKRYFIKSDNLIAGYNSTNKTITLQKYFSVDEILSMADEFIEKYKVE